MGCVWHVTDAWKRVWIYGTNWVFMFDLSHDFQPQRRLQYADGKKRKREDHGMLDASTSGAGSKTAEKEQQGLKLKVKKLTAAGGATQVDWVDPNKADSPELDDEDMDDDREYAPLAKGNRSDAETGESDVEGEDGTEIKRKPTLNWSTFKYRPILGLVPLEGSDEEALEVVLVERPQWDVEAGAGAKYVGIHG